jgi:alpha-tubulin N-acetyltransferase 1
MIDAMLEDKHLEMRQVPIDRPSALCLSFMKRHFGLSEYINQSNHFVVFDEFWENEGISRNPLLPVPNNHARTNIPSANVLKAIIPNPAKRTHFNPITWSVHPGIDQ